MIRIVNLRTYRAVEGEVLIKVDRSSVLGNPFFMHNESERDLVCDQYEEYFYKQVPKNAAFTNALRNIYRVMQTQDVALGCWCYPKRCHAETIMRFLNKAALTATQREKENYHE